MIFMDWQKIIFLSDLQGCIKNSRAWCFQRHLCSVGKEQKRRVSKGFGNKNGLRSRGHGRLTIVSPVRERGGTVAEDRSFFSFSLGWKRRWSVDRWCFGATLCLSAAESRLDLQEAPRVRPAVAAWGLFRVATLWKGPEAIRR